MKLVKGLVCALVALSAAAQAQSQPKAPYKSASASKTVGFTSEHAAATGTFSGELGGGVLAGKKGAPEKVLAQGAARASADVTLFGRKLRVAGIEAAARSELTGSTASASISVKRTVCDLTVQDSRAAGSVSLPTARWEIIVFKAQTTFSLFGIPITVKGSFGAGMDNSLAAKATMAGTVKGRVVPLTIGVEGNAAVYALVRIRVEASAGIGGVGVGGDGQILRTALQAGLGAAGDRATGYLNLVVTALRLRIYVYAWIDLPFRDRDERRKYIADLSVGGATYSLINL